MHCAAVGVLSCLYKQEGHLSALSRRGVGSSHGIVNCRPAQCCVWPVAAPAEGIVRAGSGGAAWAVPWGCFMVGSRLPCFSSGMSCVCSCQLYAAIQMSCVRITPAVCRMALNRMACGMLRSYSAVGRDRRSCVLGLPCGYRAWLVYFGFVRFFMAIPTENGGDGENAETTRGRGNEVGGAV